MPISASLLRHLSAWRAMNLEQKLYAAGFSAGLVVVLAVSITEDLLNPYAQLATYCAGLFFSIGFLSWAVPFCRQHCPSSIKHPVTPAIRGFLHFLTAVIATTLARELISHATGLPAADFDLTTAYYVLFFYPLAWALLLLPVLSFTLLISWFASMVASDLYGFVRRISGRLATPVSASFKIIPIRFLAALISLSPLFFFAATYEQFIDSDQLALRVLSYFDYQTLTNVPGVNPNRPAHLHANGLVSYLVRVNGRYAIEIASIRSSSTSSNAGQGRVGPSPAPHPLLQQNSHGT